MYLLILDEPTNFLDVFCIEALEQFLAGYDGTVILVSHDRTFVEGVADDKYVIENYKLMLKN
jgi:macrolide transport system ATP-binding/permease protein